MVARGASSSCRPTRSTGSAPTPSRRRRAALLAAKGRGRQMPPPVLVADVADARRPGHRRAGRRPRPRRGVLARRADDDLHAQPSLAWDLGDTNGTVALRMPDHATALALLQRTGPLAVSSANTTGQPAATTAEGAVEQLGDAVAVYLDAGEAPGRGLDHRRRHRRHPAPRPRGRGQPRAAEDADVEEPAP